MYLDFTDEQVALRERLRRYLDELMTGELEAELLVREGGGPLYRAAMERLGADGWLGIGWPQAYGGQGAGPIEQFIFFDEVQRSGFPVPILTLNTVGPTLLEYGTEAQKRLYPPRILAGTCHFSIGYTEPGAGTDLASLTTSAKRQGDHYLVNGQKIFCSLADHADHFWLAVRTDPDAPKHKGLSMLIVDADSPGVSMTPIRGLGDNNISAVYFENVQVPLENLVGTEGGGWRLITSQLNHERVALCAVGPLERLWEETHAFAAAAVDGAGTRLLDRPWVRRNLAQVRVGLDCLTLLNGKQAWAIANETLGMAEASAIKVYGSEFYVEGARWLAEILGAAGMLKTGSAGAALSGRLERFYRMSLVLTFGGGCNEVQRDMIAMAGLGLPRRR